MMQPKAIAAGIEFLGGAVKAEDACGLGGKADSCVVFAGRSNVGKSSLLNALTGARIARVSAEPGKTREMNFFRWQPTKQPKDDLVLIDLPGYGYAKVQAELKRQWGQEITKWLSSDERIKLVVALVDGRHGFQPNDLELVDFMMSSGLPLLVAFTKMDKHKSANQRNSAQKQLKEVAGRVGVEKFVFVSALASGGVRDLEKALRELRPD